MDSLSAVGLLAAWYTAEKRARKLHLAYEHVFYLVVWCAIGGFASAKILFCITEWRSFLEDPLQLIGSEGFVVYGGIIGGILSGWIYCRVKKLKFLSYFDLMSRLLRWLRDSEGSVVSWAGCCYGKETSGPLSVTFTNSDFAPNNVALIPTQIYSSILDFGHFFLLLYIARHKKADGQVAACYLIFYSIGRFVLEFFRGDLERGSVGNLSTSQFISIFTVLAGILTWFLAEKMNKSEKRA